MRPLRSASLAPVVALALLGAWPAAAPGHEPESALRRVSFQVDRSREVANDRVRAVVGISDEDADPAALAGRINEVMAWALDTARGASGVRVESGGYQTYPVHEKGRIRRWRASQDAILESGDPGALSKLLGRLQSRLELRSLDFSVSPERRREVEDELVVEALAAFRARASLVRGELGASGYEIVQVSIDAGGMVVAQRHRAGRVMMAEADVAPPALEAGSSQVTVHVSATIELD